MTEAVRFSGGYIDITPSSPMRLAGYCARRKKSKGIADPLEANVIVLRRGAAQAAFAQVDVLSAGDELRRRILDGLPDLLAEEELLLVASHTHFAPGVDSRLPDLGAVCSDYVAEVVGKMVTLLRGVLSAEGKPAYLRYGECRAAHSINRRRSCLRPALKIPPVRRVMALRPNPAGKTDETVRALAVMDASDARLPVGVLWNYACHPVSFYKDRAISADYPGVVRRSLRARFGSDLPVLFLPGFCGDTRPNKISRLSWSPRRLLDGIVNGPGFAKFAGASWRRWGASLADVVVAALSDRPRELEIRGMRCGRRSCAFQDLVLGELDDRALTCQYVALDDSCILIGISAEVVVAYAEELQQLFPERIVIPISCIDGVCGYLPTSDMRDEGGLEVTSPGYSLGRFQFRPGVSERVLKTIRALAGVEKRGCETA
jgi:hypothetical protein